MALRKARLSRSARQETICHDKCLLWHLKAEVAVGGYRLWVVIGCSLLNELNYD